MRIEISADDLYYGKIHTMTDAVANDDYITLIGSEWADPIADIASAWRARLIQPGYHTHLTLRDKGACKAIMLLLAVMLESYSLRAATGNVHEEDTAKTSKFDVRDWWKRSKYPAFGDVLDVFVIRDVLVHNHLYSYSENWHSDDATVYSHIKGGDLLFRDRVVDGKLKHTALSCNPETIGPKDVIEVTKITRQALRYLSNNYSSIGETDFNFARRGKSSTLWDGIEDAANEAITLIDSGKFSQNT